MVPYRYPREIRAVWTLAITLVIFSDTEHTVKLASNKVRTRTTYAGCTGSQNEK